MKTYQHAFEVADACIVDAEYRVRKHRKSTSAVIHRRSSDEVTRGELAKPVVWVGLAAFILSAVPALFIGDIAELRDVRLNVMALVFLVLGYYFATRARR